MRPGAPTAPWTARRSPAAASWPPTTRPSRRSPTRTGAADLRVGSIRAMTTGAGDQQPVRADGERLTVLVYSDDVTTRDKVKLALGRRPAADLPLVDVRRGRHRAGRHPPPGQGRHRPGDPRRRGHPRRRAGHLPPAQGRDLPLPAGPGADRPAAGRLAGHLVARRRGRAAPARPDRARRRGGRRCCAAAPPRAPDPRE